MYTRARSLILCRAAYDPAGIISPGIISLGIILPGIILLGINLLGLILPGIHLHGIIFLGIILPGIVFLGIILLGVIFLVIILPGIHLLGIILFGINLLGIFFLGINPRSEFHKVEIENALLSLFSSSILTLSSPNVVSPGWGVSGGRAEGKSLKPLHSVQLNCRHWTCMGVICV